MYYNYGICNLVDWFVEICKGGIASWIDNINIKNNTPKLFPKKPCNPPKSFYVYSTASNSDKSAT